MTWFSAATSSVVLTCLTAPAAGLAQPARATAEVGARARAGDVIYVMDTEGRETKGTLLALSDTTLTLGLLGDRYDVPLARVARIERDGDSVWSGFAVGASIGAGMGLVASQTWAAECDCTATGVTYTALFYGGIGALIDWANRGRTLLYRAPVEPPKKTVTIRPVVSRNGKSVTLAIRW